MAIHSIGLSELGSTSADSNKRLFVHSNDVLSGLFLKWRTASGADINRSFDIALNYRAVPKVTTEGGGLSGWATEWDTWASKIPFGSCNPQYVDGGYQWSIDFATLLGMDSVDLLNILFRDGNFNFDHRYYDRIEFGIRIKSHYTDEDTGTDETIGMPGTADTSPRTDTTFIIDYVPNYTIEKIYCDKLETVKVKYSCEGWLRSDDRFCIEALSVGGEDIVLSKPWGTAANGIAEFPMSALSDIPLGATVDLEVRFNPSYGATGEEFARASYSGECQGGGGANPPALTHSVRDGVLYIKPDDSGASGSPIVATLVKVVGSEYPFDQQTVEVGDESAWPYVKRGEPFQFRMIGIDGSGNISEARTFNTRVEPSAPVEVVSLRNPKARAMAKYDLTISDDYAPEANTFKLADRERETTCYGVGGSAVWNLSASLLKNTAGAYDTEAAWRKVSASGDCVLLLSDGTRRVVSVGTVRFSRNHPGFTGISTTMREVDA